MAKLNLNISTGGNPMLDAALGHARAGRLVLPLYGVARVGFGSDAIVCTCRAAAACTAPGKHPCVAHGIHDASRDPSVLRAWFTNRTDLNLGMVAGAVSGGLLVVDIDRRKDGDKTLAQLEHEHGRLPDGAVVRTGNGEHHYLQLPRGLLITSSAGALGSGVDIKSENGYVCTPPSRHLSGHLYSWRSGNPPARLPAAPKWLIDLAKSGSARVSGSGQPSGAPGIRTADHREGRILARVLGAKDCQHYWRFECPVRAHRTPDAAFYPRAFGAVYFKCFSDPPCTHDEIAAVVRKML